MHVVLDRLPPVGPAPAHPLRQCRAARSDRSTPQHGGPAPTRRARAPLRTWCLPPLAARRPVCPAELR
eukprot:543911-Rhodomonas_salina.2